MRLVFTTIGVIWLALGCGLALTTLLALPSAPNDPNSIAAHLALGLIGAALAVACGVAFVTSRRWAKSVIHICAAAFGLYAVAYILIEGGGSGAKPFLVAVGLLVLVTVSEILAIVPAKSKAEEQSGLR